MTKPELFNSKSKAIPHLRPDLDIIPVNDNGQSYLYFHDVRGYVSPDFALARSAGTVLSLFDGTKSVNDLKPHLGNGVTTDTVLQYVRFLDENRVLQSPHFRHYAEQVERQYEEDGIHISVTAGSSYPDEPEGVTALLDEAFAEFGTAPKGHGGGAPKALYAPHIDPRAGMKNYVESFQHLRGLTPSRVVILATSHYAGYYPEVYRDTPFIVSSKYFQMPLGTVPANREAIDAMKGGPEQMGLSFRDRAHRIEHSIELHLLFLQYLWNHEFTVIPIAVGALDELFYMPGSHLSRQVDRFARHLAGQFGGDDDTFFLISGDLAHVGKKFGDNRPARAMNDEVRQFDRQFLESAATGNSEQILTLMKRECDPYRICGFPPLFTFLKAFPGYRGKLISYDRWDQPERESAVTFGSILYS